MKIECIGFEYFQRKMRINVKKVSERKEGGRKEEGKKEGRR
jgi:hypothetical protein